MSATFFLEDIRFASRGRDELPLRKVAGVLHYSLIYRTALFFVVDLS